MGLCIKTKRKENENMGKLLLKNGQVVTYERAVAASRIVAEINGRRVSVCFEDVGFGPDTNVIRFKGTNAIEEIGNLSDEVVKQMIIDLEKGNLLDVSHIPVSYTLPETDTGEYVYLSYAYKDRMSVFSHVELGDCDNEMVECYNAEVCDVYDEDDGWGDIFEE